jgi:hypothetical protein
MSYCNINDAFNINSNFENTIRGINSFNPLNNTLENIKSGYSSNLNGQKSQFESEYYPKTKILDPNYEPDYNNYHNPNIPQPLNDGMYDGSNDNMSWGSLNGTDLLSNNYGNKVNSSLSNTQKKSNSNSNSNSNFITQSISKTNTPSRKLTHRECINIYNNPDSYKQNVLTQALKHVSKCKLCKDEIKNMIISSSEKDNNIGSKKKNINLNDMLSESENESNLQETILTQNENKKINASRKNSEDNFNYSQTEHNNYLRTNNSKIESELKLLNEKINGESNLKYQNAMLQNNLSKYLEDLEEKKKINYKLDKIMELVNLNLSKTNKFDNLLTSGEYQNQNLLNPINQLPPQLSQLPPQLSTQFINNLLNLSQQNGLINQPVSNVGWETYMLYIGMTIIILLLIINIIMRFSSKD